MSKQHHFTVWHDSDTGWDIGHAKYDEEEPLYNTETEEWSGLSGKDARRDDELLEDLRKRLKARPEE